MKILLLVAVLVAGVWFVLWKAKQNAAVRQMAEAPEKYAKSLQNDEARAKQAAEQANKAIEQTSQEVQKAVDAEK